MEGTERNKDITGKENRKKTKEGHSCHHILQTKNIREKEATVIRRKTR